MDQQKKLTSEAFAGQTRKETQTDLVTERKKKKKKQISMGTDHVLHLVGDVESESRSGASSSPSDVTEGRLVDDHAIHSIKQILDSFFSPGRKELERENHTVVRQPIVDLVDNLHASLLACCCCCCTSSSSSFPGLLLSDFCHELQRHGVRKTTIPEELKQRPHKSLLAPIGQDSNPSSSREHNASEIRTSTSKAQTHTETHKKTTITKPRKKDRGRKKRTRSEIGPRKTERERATTTTSASLPRVRDRLFYDDVKVFVEMDLDSAQTKKTWTKIKDM